MIVPRSPLLVLLSGAVIPLIALGTFVPQTLILVSLTIFILFIVTVADAFFAPHLLGSISVSSPQRARLSQKSEGTVNITVKNKSSKHKMLRLGLVFPQGIRVHDESLTAGIEGDSTICVLFTCTPLRRGNFSITTCYSEIQSSLGLWAVRRKYDIELELQVYPNLLPERKNFAALFLNRGFFGIHTQRQVGKGREFEKLREYMPGDIYEDIDWKATARRGRPITKVYQIERTQEVYTIIDCSRLSTRYLDTQELDSEKSTLLERFITSSLFLALAAQKQGDLFGLLTFSDKIITFLRAQQGKAHYRACLNSLYILEPQNVTPDFDELVSFISLKLRRRALLVFLTNLNDPVLAESFVKNIELISKKHLVVIAMLRPHKAVPLFTDSELSTEHDMYERLGGHIEWAHLRETEKKLKTKGIRFALMDSEKMSIQLVTQYMNIKKRQLI
jgi:uncharacterized protein (DUF58 family)